MHTSRKAGVLLAAGLSFTLLAGCGGGSADSSSTSTALGGTSRGALALQVVFPTASRGVRRAGAATRNSAPGDPIPGFSNGNIPFGTKAVRIEVISTATPATALALPQTITAPGATTGTGLGSSNVTGPQTISFTNLPVGKVLVRVTAYPDTPAILTPIAVGTTTVTIAANASASATVPLTLTIDHITLTPATQTVTTSPKQISVTAFDASNRPLLVPLLINNSRPDLVNVLSTLPAVGQPVTTTVYDVTDRGVAQATTTVAISVAEPNSGKSGAATVTVQID